MKSAICALLVGLMASSAAAGPPKHWHEDDDRWREHRKHHDDDDDDRNDDRRLGIGCYLGPRDVWIISDYYAPRYRALPPGLQKKLYRTGRLPPGWEKKMEPFPAVVERELVPIPYGYRRGLIDGYAVVYEPHTHVVIDVAALFGP